MMKKLQLVPGNTKKVPNIARGRFCFQMNFSQTTHLSQELFFCVGLKSETSLSFVGLQSVIENVWAVVCSETTRSWLIIRWHGSVAQLIMDLVCKASQAGYIWNELKGPCYGVFFWILILASCQTVLNTLDYIKKFQVFVTLLPPSVGFW